MENQGISLSSRGVIVNAVHGESDINIALRNALIQPGERDILSSTLRAVITTPTRPEASDTTHTGQCTSAGLTYVAAISLELFPL